MSEHDEEGLEREETIATVAEHVHMFAMFLLALNDACEHEALELRDILYDLMTPEDSYVPPTNKDN